MASTRTPQTARAGDRIEVRRPDGSLASGVIVEVLGHADHTHFQVRWNAAHESMVFPGEDVRVLPGGSESPGRPGA